jgi:Vitamin K-dependent gamma-carboxylase
MSIARAWNRFWFSRADPLPLCITRIGVGVIWLAFLMVTAPNWERFYGADGILSLHESDLNARRTISSFSMMHLTDGWMPIAVWWWIGLVLATAVTIGFQSRIATIGLFLFASSVIQRNNYIINGEELVTRMLLFYGCFSPWGQRLSVDRWLCQRNAASKPSDEGLPLVWSWRLVQINFLLIYMISLPNKFADDISWLNGDALHWTLASDRWWSRGWMSEITLNMQGIPRKLMTWGTVLIEGAFPLLVWFRRTRIPVTLAIMSLHLGIAFCVSGVALFTLSMVVGAMMFIPGETYEAMGRWINAKWNSLNLRHRATRPHRQEQFC